MSDEFPPRGGGAGVVAATYANLLAEAGCEVTVVTSFDVVGGRADKSPYKIVFAGEGLLRHFRYWRMANKEEYHCIILNDQVATLWAGLFLPRRLLARAIMFLHGSEPEMIFEGAFSPRLFVYRWLYKRAALNVLKIVAVSQYMRQKFLLRTPLGSVADKMTVIYSPAQRDIFFRQNSVNHKRVSGLPSNSRILLTVGRIIKGKGFDEKLRVFKRLREYSDENWYWVIVGDGEYKEELLDAVKDGALEANVCMMGKVAREDLRAWYSVADVFCLLSRMDESFGLVYVESQLCGCPTIGRNNAGVKEVIADNVSGFLVDDEEECFDIIYHKKYLSLNKLNILKNGEKFSTFDVEGFFSGLEND